VRAKVRSKSASPSGGAEKKVKASCHLSKIVLFVKDKNDARAFFSATLFLALIATVYEDLKLFFCCAIYSFFHRMQVKIDLGEKKLYFRPR
jgi:hypothetical protein